MNVRSLLLATGTIGIFCLGFSLGLMSSSESAQLCVESNEKSARELDSVWASIKECNEINKETRRMTEHTRKTCKFGGGGR